MDEPRLIRLLNAAHRTLAERRILFAVGLLAAGASFLWPLFHADPSLVVSGYPAMGMLTLLLGLMLSTLPVPRFIALFFLHERLNPRPAHPAESLWAMEIAQDCAHLEGLVRPWKASHTAMPRHVVIQVWARWKSDSTAR
ncbi:MAG: hypothetical protein P3W87_002135 [Gammaproteobacteria bacterium]|nr:hypothetical protein [Gammaproteobacteria bacterium]